MIRRILVPLDPSSYTTAALEYAFFFAKQHKSEVCGLAVLDVPEIVNSVSSIASESIYNAEKLKQFRKNEAYDRIQLLLKQFHLKCEREGVAHCEEETQGTPSKMIIQKSIFYDLIIIGLCTYYHFETNEPCKFIDKFLDHSVTPILAVPDYFKPIKNVLIAFDGSLPAADALHRFTDLANKSNFEITLLMANRNKKKVNQQLGNAEIYLRKHGLNNIKKVQKNNHIIRTMKEEFLNQADMVVAGVHSKKGILDFLVGSLTKFLIKEGGKPLFLGP